MEKGEHLKRQNRPTMLQLRYLTDLKHIGKKRGAQKNIAERCGVYSSTVNRYFKSCMEKGILTDELDFTIEGEEWLNRYTSLYENLLTYLQEIGGTKAEADETSELLVENVDIHMLELMIMDHDQKKTVYARADNHLDKEIQNNLQKCERHPVVFRLYRVNKKPGQSRDSMAMGGFEEIAEIVQDGDRSYLELKLKDMTGLSRVSGETMIGHLKTLKYEHEGILTETVIENNSVRIPMEACKIHRWTGVGTMGSVPVTVTCSIGQIHMPESTALLYFWV